MRQVHQDHIVYQKAIRAYVAEIDKFPPKKKDNDNEPSVGKPMKIQEWLEHLTAVHAYIAVPQCSYQMKRIEGEKRKYDATVIVDGRLVYSKMSLTVPEINQPPVIADNRYFKNESFQELSFKF